MGDSPGHIVTLRQSYPKPAPTPTVGRASRPPPGRPRPVSTRRATRHGSADSVGMLNEGQRATHCSTNLLGISTDRLPRPARRRPTFIPTYRELTLAATRKSYQTNPSPQPGYLRIRSYRDGDAAGAMTMIKDRDRAPASSWRKRARAGGGDFRIGRTNPRRLAYPRPEPLALASGGQARVPLPQPPDDVLRQRPHFLGGGAPGLALDHAQTLAMLVTKAWRLPSW